MDKNLKKLLAYRAQVRKPTAPVVAFATRQPAQPRRTVTNPALYAEMTRDPAAFARKYLFAGNE